MALVFVVTDWSSIKAELASTILVFDCPSGSDPKMVSSAWVLVWIIRPKPSLYSTVQMVRSLVLVSFLCLSRAVVLT